MGWGGREIDGTIFCFLVFFFFQHILVQYSASESLKLRYLTLGSEGLSRSVKESARQTMECATSARAEYGLCNNKSQSPLTNEVGQGRWGYWEGEKIEIEKLFLALGLAFGFFFLFCYE